MGEMLLTFSDGEAVNVPLIDDASILVSAEKAGLSLANNCRAGTCRTCVAKTPAGDDVLLCIQPSEAGCEVELPYKRIDVVQPTIRRAKINRFAKVSGSVWEVRFRLQFPLPFLAGQYVEVSFPGMDSSRRFSMANAPGETEQIFHIRDLPGGATSAFLTERARPEDAFTVRGPFGVFYMRKTKAPKILIGGGTGLAPLVSMLREAATRGVDFPMAIIAGASSSADAYAIEELTALSETLPLEVIVTTSRLADGWTGNIGNPVEALGNITSVPFNAECEAYLCGPPGMVEAARKELVRRGLTTALIFNEEFVHNASA